MKALAGSDGKVTRPAVALPLNIVTARPDAETIVNGEIRGRRFEENTHRCGVIGGIQKTPESEARAPSPGNGVKTHVTSEVVELSGAAGAQETMSIGPAL